MPRATVALPAILGEFGLGQGGLKVATGLYESGWDVTTVSVRSQNMSKQPWKHEQVPLDLVLSAALRTPIRLREAWLVHVHYVGFDLLCRRTLEATDIFYGFSQGCLLSMRKARQLGAATVLYAANTHVAAVRQIVDLERRKLGLGSTTITRSLVRRAEAEYHEADSIRAESTLTAKTLVSRGVPAQKITIVPPAVNLNAFQPAPHEPRAFTVGYVGAFSVRKGFHILAEAWQRFADGKSRLLLHGGASERWGDVVLRRLSQRPDVEVRTGPTVATYRDSSVVVVPSVEDGFAYVVLEALACGVPVIASTQVGAKDVIVDGLCGYVFPSGDVSSLVAQLVALREAGALTPFRSAARSVAEQYSFAAEGKRLTSLFENLLRDQRSNSRTRRAI